MPKNVIFTLMFLLLSNSTFADHSSSKKTASKSLNSKASAESLINMTCVTEFPSTSFFVRQNGDVVKVRVLHHNGIKFAPIWSGLVTPNDISTITEAADTAAKLSEDFEITWNRDGCNADSETFFQCVGQAQDFTTATGEKVHPWALSVYDVTENSIYGVFKKKTVSLRFNVQDKPGQITMDYQPNDCFVDSTKPTTK